MAPCLAWTKVLITNPEQQEEGGSSCQVLAAGGELLLQPVSEALAEEEAMPQPGSLATGFPWQSPGHLPWGDGARGTEPKGAALLLRL